MARKANPGAAFTMMHHGRLPGSFAGRLADAVAFRCWIVSFQGSLTFTYAVCSSSEARLY
jgi:hypothetical protein